MFHFMADMASQPPLSLIWSHVILSLLTAFFQAPVLSSRETPRISNPLSLYLPYSFINCLFEKRQGTHHEAQKSSKNTFPFIDDKRMESPFRSGKEKSS